jgi:RNA polymerase sigma-70 factor, ECF subfamily
MVEGIVQVTRPEEVERAPLEYARLAHAHVDAAYQLAGYLLGDATEAQDAVQDALVKAWKNWGSLRTRGSFNPWFDRIVVNVCRDRMRRHRTVRIVDLELAGEVPAVDEFHALLAEDEVTRAVGRMSPEHRIVIAMRFWQDLTLEETADRLGLPVGTVKSRQHYALQALRAEFKASSHGA